MIVTCGEAVADLIPTEVDGETVYRPVLGGSLYNVALGIARLGGSAGYQWELSVDTLGQKFLAALEDAGVDCSAVTRSDRPTPVAVVDLSGDEPRYNIADPGHVMTDTAIAPPPPHTSCFQIGSAVLARDPVGADIEAAARLAPFTTIDINARPPSIVEPSAYRARLRRIASFSGVVKASVVDIGTIGEGDAEAYMSELVAKGAAMAVLTSAEDGAVAFTARERVWLPSAVSAVVDPVGAGDSLMAALLTTLQARDLLSVERVAAVKASELEDILAFAQSAAAYTCAHHGAVMPTARDL